MKRISLYSQNFLRSPRLVNELIGHTNITTNDIVFDIGAGTGVITFVLAKHCRSVVAVELDPRIAAKLRSNTQHSSNVVVYQTDFLLMPTPSTPYKVFANIPFNKSAAIVRKLTQNPNPPEVAYLVVQKEFANKLLSESGEYISQLALILGLEFNIRIRKHLSQSDFLPQPQVSPVLLEIRRRSVPLLPADQLTEFHKFVTQIYGHTRSVKNAMAHFISFREFSEFAKSEGLALNVRPSQMRLSQWIRLFRLVSR